MCDEHVPLLLVEQLRAPSPHNAVAFPKLLLIHDAGCTIASSEQTNVVPDGVREGSPGSATGIVGAGPGGAGPDVRGSTKSNCVSEETVAALLVV